MNRILQEIRKIIDDNMALYLPHVKSSDLEKSGAIFYMNGNNGTEFDWYVNDRLPAFMVFYDDRENLGAVKVMLHNTGAVEVYLYDEKGKTFLGEVHAHLDADETDLLQLAVLLKNRADDQGIWGADVEEITTDFEISCAELNEFQSRQEHYAVMKNRRNILNLYACVSKKITEEGWKVGYMERNEPHDKEDSGWFFAAGTEEDGYFSDINNLDLICVGNVWQDLDPDIFPYIDMPIGTRMIRMSQENFEIDQNNQEIYAVKR